MHHSERETSRAVAPGDAGPNVAFVGIMGTGKSSVGKQVAAGLGYQFVDSDASVVTMAGRSIPGIFAEEGEAGFRQREAAVLKQLVSLRRHVIATGGGIILTAENRSLLRCMGCVVWLTADVPTLLFRIRQNRERPLMKVEDPETTLRELLEVREPLYREVEDLTIDTSDLTIEETVHGVVESIHYHFSKTGP